MKLRYLFFCSLFLIQLSRAGDDPPEPGRARQGTLSLEEATRAAVANNAAIKAARAKWEMMKSRVPQAAAWEDPMAGVDFERFGTTQFGTYTDAEWMLSQKIPLAGKNRSRARAANAEERVEQALQKVPGVEQVRAKSSNQRVRVMFDSTVLDANAIAERIANAGYETKVVSAP